ncbi:hypothetical protein DPMN_136743 [Dreissena polymorpha]|uniref:Uncharacterized protein n=1 Tax=Dreissena polymorpha TaxID=45954 RepID=A0A9D4G0G4_DREPO|nr:hypothetical protein DPMN_136743 [Dreissena polymorpha]
MSRLAQVRIDHISQQRRATTEPLARQECAKNKKAFANSVDPDETPHDAASHQGLRCLLKGISDARMSRMGWRYARGI